MSGFVEASLTCADVRTVAPPAVVVAPLVQLGLPLPHGADREAGADNRDHRTRRSLAGSGGLDHVGCGDL